jgi:hypothetical protein
MLRSFKTRNGERAKKGRILKREDFPAEGECVFIILDRSDGSFSFERVQKHRLSRPKDRENGRKPVDTTTLFERIPKTMTDEAQKIIDAMKKPHSLTYARTREMFLSDLNQSTLDVADSEGGNDEIKIVNERRAMVVMVIRSSKAQSVP